MAVLKPRGKGRDYLREAQEIIYNIKIMYKGMEGCVMN
ncbi:hypothetical protein CCACVL1_05099 [Corchorus capsularis]|uniref:Uncharacterized protein n=1 Tax=Corchorus capsularis TaxID=210143 RepID=A0A1R3JMN3_COCAP|nr:hypothetical protein CCACVL1_05099 [Corchorus capsularis]